MPERTSNRVDMELFDRIRSIRIARGRLFDVDTDRRKRIDDAIDYFGDGRDLCGESLLDDTGTK
jgi:hypothetical protein